MVNATNPQALVFYLAVLPQFVTPAASLLRRYAVIGLTFVTTDIVVVSSYAGLATRLVTILGNR
ncbi:LysE family transporter [Mycobacterium sp. AZCC_0083]|uniref:LysE family transporter n=1 Tax=Mycobacterium sp. AZCC_0083 TaxID=2735882 RepID=UPI002105AF48|nr:LysE family transporter [Mycobacterium sp. AZCC_0083]